MNERLALASFHETAEKVPAYRDFLSEHGLENHKQVKTIKDFKEVVPVMDKASYIKRYPLDQRCIKKMHDSILFTTSGGTTAEPTLVNLQQKECDLKDLESLLYYLFKDYLSKRVLFINAFSQGSWTAGVTTNFVFGGMAQDPKNNFSVASPGLNAELTISIIDRVGKFYDVIFLAGCPSFLRLLYYEGMKRGLNWNAHKVVLFSGGESMVKFKHFFKDSFNINPYTDLFNLYATTEAGPIGGSTPLTWLVEELYEQNPTYFGLNGVASFFQTAPVLSYLEELDGELLITRDSKSTIMPLIRYKLSDAVKLYKYKEMESIWRNHFNVDPTVMLKERGFSGAILKWPFLAVKGRSDQSAVVVGVNVYPHDLTDALNLAEDDLINNFSFGFDGVEERFVIYLELFPGVSISPSDLPNVTKKYHDRVVENLSRINMQWYEYYKAVPMADPIIKICAHGEGPFKDDHKRVKPKHLFTENKSNRAE
ncbi:MAG: phenylacetate--CoA ligase family protein [Halobacteriota archaeon]